MQIASKTQQPKNAPGDAADERERGQMEHFEEDPTGQEVH